MVNVSANVWESEEEEPGNLTGGWRTTSPQPGIENRKIGHPLDIEVKLEEGCLRDGQNSLGDHI